MKRIVRAALLGAFLACSAHAASLDTLDRDGWHTWRVAAVEGAPAWCCFSRHGDTTTARTCNLDDHFGYGSCDDAVLDGFVQVYAKLEGGKPVDIRVLSPGCPVESKGSVADLGQMDSDASFNWLSGLVRPGSRVSEDALTAIAQHRGDAPREFLIEKAQEAVDNDVRRSAMFWLAMTGAGESEAVIMGAMTSDPDRDVREQAVFALSRLPEERAIDALVAVLRDRGLDRELRESALFWLAQSGSDRALAVVEQLLAAGNAGAT